MLDFWYSARCTREIKWGVCIVVCLCIYLASNIQGVLKVKKDVEGDTYTEEEKAGFAVTGNKLKYTYGDFVTNLTKCQ